MATTMVALDNVWLWLAWAVALIVQNASFTLVSRARNSKSLGYHAAAAVGSNGIWFLSQLFLLNSVFGALLDKGNTVAWLAAAGGWYTLWTIVGSVGMHWLALHKIEPRVRA
jgi:hypothetical protein